MSEIKMFGSHVETGTLTVDTGEFGHEVCITFATVFGPSQFNFKAVLDPAKAEALRMEIDKAIDEANDRITDMQAEAMAILNPPPPEPEEGGPGGFKYCLQLEKGKPPQVIELEDIPF
jgi:hypothetical protein